MKQLLKFNTTKNIAILILIVFSCVLSFCYHFINYNEERGIVAYSNTISSVKDFQTSYNSNNNQNVTPNTEPIYNNGFSALISAYGEFTKLDYFEVSVVGNIFADAGVIKYDMTIQCDIRKQNGITESYVHIYCPTSADRSSGSHTIHSNGFVEIFDSNKVSMKNGKIVVDYNGATSYKKAEDVYLKDNGIMPGELFYTINEKTVTSTSNFFVKTDTSGNIVSYNTDFILSPTLSTTKYIKLLTNIMEGSKNYVFEYCNGTLILDGNGKIQTLQTKEKYNLDFNLFGDAYWDVTCTSSMKYDIKI